MRWVELRVVAMRMSPLSVHSRGRGMGGRGGAGRSSGPPRCGCRVRLEGRRGPCPRGPCPGWASTRRAVSVGVLPDRDADRFQRRLLRLRGARGAGDDGARVAHGLALGRGEAGDVADDGLGDVLADVRGRPFLGVAADLPDEDDQFGVGVVLEGGEAVDVGGADDGVAADADAGGEADVAQLVHELVGEGAGLGDQADPAGLGDVGGDDARVGLAGGDQAGAVGADDRGCPCSSRTR